MASNKSEKVMDVKEKAETGTDVQEDPTADVLQENDPTACDKTVTIRIPRTKENGADVFVSVNERSWLIQRGVSVEVPECVAEVLRHQEEMMEESYIFEEQIGHKE